MRLALLAPLPMRTPPRHYGPRATLVSQLCEELIAREVDVTLCASAESHTRGKLTTVCPTPGVDGAGHAPGIWEALHLAVVSRQAQSFDLIHNYGNLLPLTCAHLFPTPIVTTVYDPIPAGILSLCNQEEDGRQYFVAPSVAGRQAGLEYLATISPGIAVQTLPFRDTPGDYVAFCGRLTADSGVTCAAEIAAQAQMPLRIAGPIEDERFFHTQLAPQLAPGKVDYVGPLASAACYELLAQAYALLQPCQTAKPFSLSTIEAMACGTPVVARAVGVMPELIAEGDTGFLVADNADAVAKLKLVADLDRQRCRQWVAERFGVEQMVTAYLDVYKGILEREKPRARHAAPPWGRWEVLLDEPSYKVKRITVLPQQRLSYQKHFKREEYWTIVEGRALVTLDDHDTAHDAGATIHIACETAHRIANPGPQPLVFIEVQRGTYFGEDDIVRLQDDYGRQQP
jgi:mannose-6-phosphate isomerase-like protein (cupin superfamily)/glycosyltransferase involved in cell wall biosynthesis